MATILLIARNIGPSEASVVDAFRATGHQVHVYDVSGRFVTGGGKQPIWMRGYELRTSPLSRNLLASMIDEQGIDHVVASGVEACGFAAHNLTRRFIPLLWPTDLDFSASRLNMTRDLEQLLRMTDRLLLPDDYEMDKALAKGSRVAHLRLPLPPVRRDAYLGTLDTPRVALLHATGQAPEATEYAWALSAISKAHVEPMDIAALYSAADLQAQRGLHATMARLEGFSHAVVTGVGPHHVTVLRMLQGQASRMVVEPTISTGVVAQELGYQHVARGLAVGDLLRQVTTGQPSPAEQPGAPQEDYLNVLQRAMNRPVDPELEELTVVASDGPVNVFFAVGALQDQSNGARPMRIRNMSEAVGRRAPTLRVPCTAHAVRRRTATLRRLIDGGREIGIFYGENSTSPMDPDVLPVLTDLISTFNAHGGRSAWFVRDLHWLDEFDGYLTDRDARAEIRKRGLAELTTLAAVAHLLAAPSESSAQHFNALLALHGEATHEWMALPPAIDAAGVVGPPPAPAPEDEVTVLYVGGTGGIYAMGNYLDALRDLPERFRIDFIARPAEQETLVTGLEERGLHRSGRCRVLTTTLERYAPRTQHCIGTVLLDSDYARLSFPYKTVSMVERGFPVLCYQDMGIADFVVSRDVGLTCGRSPESIHGALLRLSENWPRGIEEAQRSEGWDARVTLLQQELRSIQPEP